MRWVVARDGADDEPECVRVIAEVEVGFGIGEDDEGMAICRRAAVPSLKRERVVQAAAGHGLRHERQAGARIAGLQVHGDGIQVGNRGEDGAVKNGQLELEIHPVPKLRRGSGEHIVDDAHLAGVYCQSNALVADDHSKN